MAQQSQCRFLALPPELRSLVWQFCCSPEDDSPSESEADDNIVIEATEPRPTETSRKLVFHELECPTGGIDEILQVCRQMRAETAPVWFSDILVSFSSPKAIDAALHNAPWIVEWWQHVEIKDFGKVTVGRPGAFTRIKWKKLMDVDILSEIPNVERLVLQIKGLGCSGSTLKPEESAELVKVVEDALPDDVWPRVIELYGNIGIGCSGRHWMLVREFQVRLEMKDDAYVVEDEWYGAVFDNM